MERGVGTWGHVNGKVMAGLRSSWSVGGNMPADPSELVAGAPHRCYSSSRMVMMPSGVQDARSMRDWRARWGN